MALPSVLKDVPTGLSHKAPQPICLSVCCLIAFKSSKVMMNDDKIEMLRFNSEVVFAYCFVCCGFNYASNKCLSIML